MTKNKDDNEVEEIIGISDLSPLTKGETKA
jgi:hypothetical protein